MTIEQLLRQSAHDVADGLEPPVPELSTIHAGARTARRQRVAVAGAAAAVAAVVVVVAIPSGDRTPEPAPPPDPVVVRDVPVWADDEGIHLGDRTYQTQHGSRVRALSLVADGVVYTDERSRVWFQPRRGAAVQIGLDDRYTLLADADGTTAAWFEPEASGRVLVVYDTATQRTVVRSSATADQGRKESAVAGQHVGYRGPIALVDGDQVVYHTPTEVWSYDAASDTYEVIAVRESDPSGHLRYAVDFAPGVRTQIERELGEDVRTTFVADNGTSLSTVDEVEAGGAFDSEGTVFAGVGPGADGEQVLVVDPATGATRALTPGSGRYPIVGWGYGDTLMVVLLDTEAEPMTRTLLECDSRTGDCRDLPVGDSPLLPHN